MNFKLLIVSTLYKEYLSLYYKKYKTILTQTYQEQYDHLLNDASEFISSYTRTFNEIGIETRCIISNAQPLQNKWLSEKGHHLKNDEEIILEQIKDFKPDVLWIENKNYIHQKFLSRIRKNFTNIKLIFAYHCAPYSCSDIENFKLLDFVLTCTPGFKNNYNNQGIKSYLVYHAFDPVILEKLNTKETSKQKGKIIFTGSFFLGGGLHNKRTKLIEEILKQNIKLEIFGNLEKRHKLVSKRIAFNIYKFLKLLKLNKLAHRIPLLNKFDIYQNTTIPYYSKKLIKSTKPPLFGIPMLNILKGANICLNNHIEIAGQYAGNMRLFEATGVGTCLLTDNKKNIQDLFEPSKEIVVYDNNEDCIEKIKWLQEHPNECEQIAKAGQKRTLMHHTVEQRCRQIAEIIDTELRQTKC